MDKFMMDWMYVIWLGGSLGIFFGFTVETALILLLTVVLVEGKEWQI